MNAIVLTVGDELLIGQVIDTNSAWIGSTFNELGINLLEILSVGDELNAIKDGIDYCLNKADVVIMTGGLGPTKDDITKVAIAQYFNVGTSFSQPTYDRIVKIFEKFGKPMQESHKEQCFMPNNAILLNNKMGTAPGMLFNHGEKILVSLPGVPFEMKAIITDELIPILKSKPSEIAIFHKTIMTAGEGESFIADRIAPLIENMPTYIKIAYLPSLGSVRLRLTGKHKDIDLLQKEINEYSDKIVNELGQLVYGYDDISLQESLMHLFKKKGFTLSAAESCTGGYFSHMITSVAGSSAYYIGSLVTYSNEMKMHLLNVNENTLKNHGAVSEETVREMVKGLLETTKSNIGVSVSGIAGPSGGSEEKPVGTIWMAVSNGIRTEAYKINATKDRLKNIEYSSTVLMNKLRLFLLD
jgi:nicotinamide-nucleotide amidase